MCHNLVTKKQWYLQRRWGLTLIWGTALICVSTSTIGISSACMNCTMAGSSAISSVTSQWLVCLSFVWLHCQWCSSDKSKAFSVVFRLLLIWGPLSLPEVLIHLDPLSEAQTMAWFSESTSWSCDGSQIQWTVVACLLMPHMHYSLMTEHLP